MHSWHIAASTARNGGLDALSTRELARLGHKVAASTVWKVLRAAGIDPIRDRTGPGWMEFIRSQAARNLLMRLGDDHGFRFLIRDGAGQFTRAFDSVLAGSGITTIRTPPRSPQANAFSQRWVRTLRHELLDHTIICNEHHLQALLVNYVNHYNNHRPHHGLRQRAPNDTDDALSPNLPDQPTQRHSTCSGLINEHHQAA